MFHVYYKSYSSVKVDYVPFTVKFVTKDIRTFCRKMTIAVKYIQSDI